ncbi:ketoacyl-ACP synthase III [Streptomyces sp. NPDC049577]|uniref:3-oxoacyl-ACP synthase III family protein n=1 Tax=Streptomyces sp. NPDC049577 TaxID=3155153 RepID=UPI00343490AE
MSQAVPVGTQAPPRAVGVLGMGVYLPPGKRSNEEVARDLKVPPEWVAARTGVHTRHVAAPHQAASDLAAETVLRAARSAGITPGDIGLLVLATSCPDELGPATACRVQARIGAGAAVAFDVGAACSGWLFATRVAHDWLRADASTGYAAVVGVEAFSKFLNPRDRATAMLFADGAAAAILGPADNGFAGIHLGTDGRGVHHALIPAGGSRRPASEHTIRDGGHTIHTDNRAIHAFITGIFPRLINDTLAHHGLTLADIDAVITTQPSPVLLRDLGERTGIPPHRLVVTGDETGNIGAAGAPYALAAAAARGTIHPGDRILLAVFGGGLTWGSALLTWTGATALGVPPPHTGRAPADSKTEGTR